MPPRILLADDSVTVQKVIELTFSDEGVQVLAVGDGRLAIDRLNADPPDIVLADVSMPECDGYQVAAHVKQTPSLSHIPVVLMTGAFEQLDEARAREVGCDGVLAKPFEPQMVIALVRELLSRAGGASPAPVVPAEPRVASGPAEGYPFEPGVPAGRAPRTLDDFFDRIDEALEAAPPPPVVTEAPAGGAQGPDTPRVASQAPLADAFSELLAHELGEAPLPPSWTPLPSAPRPEAPSQPPRASRPVIDEGFIDEVARRVVARLSDAMIRDVVSARVVEVAERLVREEIERIKTSA
jgi:CheY-like chemotaxis protein